MRRSLRKAAQDRVLVPAWPDCQQWLSTNGQVVENMKRGEYGLAAWQIWKEAFAMGAAEKERLG